MTAGAIAKDLVGQRFGDWLVLKRLDSIDNKPQWLCRCLGCNVEKRVPGNAMRRGKSSRCRNCAQQLRHKLRRSTPAQSTPSKEDQ